MVLLALRGAILVALLTVTSALSAHSSEVRIPAGALTLRDVVTLARGGAPEVRAAMARANQAQGRLRGAGALASNNPVMSGSIGPRRGVDESTDREITAELPMPLGLRRSRQLAFARAELQREHWLAEDARRLAAGQCAVAFLGVLHAEGELAIARSRRALADTLRSVAIELERTGDVARFELNVADAELSRAESEISAVRGRIARARAVLASTLGLASGTGLVLEGDLADRSWLERITDSTKAEIRPDVQAGAADLEAARAEIRRAEAERWPELALIGSYQEEGEAEEILMGGAVVSIPIFDRGQGDRAEAVARREGAGDFLDALRAAAQSEAEGARAAFGAAVEAVKQLEEIGLPRALANEGLSAESYRAGKIDLGDLLVLRRESLDTRRELNDRLLEAAIAGVDLATALDALR